MRHLNFLVLIALHVHTALDAQEKLPEGNNGIAAKYPGDKGIAEAPGVLFTDDFEKSVSVSDLDQKWDVLINSANLSIDKGAERKHSGERSLLMTIPKQTTPLATGVAKLLPETQDTLFLRWYMKFDSHWSIPGGSVHNGGSISSRYFDQGRATPGIRADGRNKFLVNFENENMRFYNQ